MNAQSSWLEELWRIIVLIAAALAVGAIFDQYLLAVLVALFAYTLRNLYNLQRLADWLGDPQIGDIPIHFGLWGDIYSRISRISSRQAEREKRLATLVDEYSASTSALPDATVALDPQGRILWFNEAASRLLGLVAAKDVGQPLQNLFRNPEIPAFIAGANYTKTLEANAPGNPVLKLEIRLAPYGEGQMLLLAQDITERIRQERVRKDFVANVSHELRTPLTVVSGFIENLQNDDSLPQQRLARPFELMSQQAERMAQIVADLLILARLESKSMAGGQSEVDIDEILRTVVDECRQLRDDAPELQVRVESTRHVLGDRDQLHSAVTNLVANAVHHTPADGSVEVVWRDEGDNSLLQVIDTGEGIAADHLPRLTERFYRVDTGRSRDRGGTGLGLAIVKHILQRHNAELEISSELGRGSCFSCHFTASNLIA